MKIKEALKEAKKTKSSVSSVQARMHKQKKKTIAYWLLEYGSESNDQRLQQLETILNATDWKVDAK